MASSLQIASGLFSSLVGTSMVLGLVVSMNAVDRSLKEPPAKRGVDFDVPEKRKQPPNKKVRPKPKPRTPKTPPPPTPMLSSAVGGVDVGLWAGSAIDLSDGAGALLGDASNVVMSADSVDSLPSPTHRDGVQYPPQARSKGITGYVTMSLSFDGRGTLTDARTVKVEPPGYGPFEDAAMRSIKMWRFSPATYQGQAVPVTGVEFTLRFELER
ncbi:MAG: TonB family protein [Myxococcales bacterium]|nr:TonB family protein [Myxococcales bacterium]